MTVPDSRPASRDSGTTLLTCAAMLFDLDGVLVDSRQCIEHVWREWAESRGKDPAPILAVAHGRRISETLHDVAPELDIATEVAWLDGREAVETRGVFPIPGAQALLEALPAHRWAIVTSGSPPVAALRMRVAGVPRPGLLITSADVARGKPAPDPYLKAAAALGVAPAECLVIEDAPAGVRAGVAAGMRVIAVAGTASREALAAADHHLDVLGRLRVVAVSDEGVTLAMDGG